MAGSMSNKLVCFVVAGQDHGVMVSVTGLTYTQVLARASVVLDMEAKCAYDAYGNIYSEENVEKIAHGSMLYFSHTEFTSHQSTDNTSSILQSRLSAKVDKFVFSLGPNPDVFSEWRMLANELRSAIIRHVPRNVSIQEYVKEFVTPLGTVSETYNDASSLPISDPYAQHCFWKLLNSVADYQRQTEECRLYVQACDIQRRVAMGA